MFVIRWKKAENPYLFRVNAAGVNWGILANAIPISAGGVMPGFSYGSDRVEDPNSIDWGPSVPEDNWCTQMKIEGELSIDLGSQDQLDVDLVYSKDLHAYFTNWQMGSLLVSDEAYQVRSGGQTVLYYRKVSDTEFHTWYQNATGSTVYWYNKDTVDYGRNAYVIQHYTKASDGSWRYTGKDKYSYTAYAVSTKPVYPTEYRDRYERMISYATGKFLYDVKPRIKYATGYWLSSLDACQGFHPYDINMVETLVQFGIEDLVPKNTSSTVLDILTDAISSKGGLLSPSGLLAAAQIFGNCYLYYKYVFLGDMSDLSEITLGTDKPFIDATVLGIYRAQPDFKPVPHVNRKLQSLAQLIVHRGGRALQSYGAWRQSEITNLGDCTIRFNARLQAYPKYLDDMRTADIILEEFGVSLSWERLAAIVPYEFIAEWFIPIEETIRSVEYNADRLNAMYQVKNLCLSAKATLPLDTPYLCAMFGLSQAQGSLTIKTYERSSRDKFPPTAPDLSLHPSISLSRVMQGASLIITRL